MLDNDDIKWINDNRKEVSQGRQIGANFRYIAYWNRDIDLDTDFENNADLPPICISGIFKELDTQKGMLSNDGGGVIPDTRFLFVYDDNSLYYITDSKDRICSDISKFFELLSLSGIPSDYIEKLDKIEIPANSGNYYKVAKTKLIGMKLGQYANKVSLELYQVNE